MHKKNYKTLKAITNLYGITTLSLFIVVNIFLIISVFIKANTTSENPPYVVQWCWNSLLIVILISPLIITFFFRKKSQSWRYHITAIIVLTLITAPFFSFWKVPWFDKTSDKQSSSKQVEKSLPATL